MPSPIALLAVCFMSGWPIPIRLISINGADSPHTTRTVLPKWLFDSTLACAAAASAIGNSPFMIGDKVPASSIGHTSETRSVAMSAFTWLGLARSVDPVMVSLFIMTLIKLSCWR